MTAIETAFRRLEAMDLSAIESTGDWGLGQMFNHLAQGVEFSMQGYPIQKPKLFQATLGTVAFKVFEKRGRMSHGLNEPIPGEVVAKLSAQDGLARLWASLETFRDFEGAMQPHFAYGGLSKHQFGRAHLLHIENHLLEVGPKAI
ncbi:DUF1569 domain-containing protein [Yoonia sp.]|nr:DUF1569 domain-containing protein [Yoonia sp.]MDC1399075.1 DUF1569 domain-containing protein [Yoonia sp.]